jgi:hypothetical protein
MVSMKGGKRRGRWSSSSSNDDPTKEDEVKEAKRVI